MTTKTTGIDKVMDEFKITKQNVAIEIKKSNICDYSADIITFDDIKGYSLNGPYLIIQIDDNTEEVYPMDSVSVLTFTTTKE